MKTTYKNNAKTAPKPRKDAPKALSYFAKTKKSQATRKDIKGNSKSEFGDKTRKPRDNFRSDFKKNSATDFDNKPPRPKFSTEESKPRFSSDSKDERPRLNDYSKTSDRTTRKGFADRKPFGAKKHDETNDRPAGRSFFRNSSFKKTSSNKFDNRFSKDSAKDNDFRSSDKFSKPRFNGDDSNPTRPKFGDDKKSKFTSNKSRDYSKPKRNSGDKKFGNRSPFSDNISNDKTLMDRGFNSRKSSSSFGEFFGKNRKPKFDSRFGENHQRNEGMSEGGKKFSSSQEGRAGRGSAGNHSGSSNKKFGSRFGAKSGVFGNKSRNSGGRKPTRPKN